MDTDLPHKLEAEEGDDDQGEDQAHDQPRGRPPARDGASYTPGPDCFAGAGVAVC